MLAVAGTIGCINIVQTELRALFLDSAVLKVTLMLLGCAVV